MRSLLTLILLLAVLVVSAYWGSPYYTVWRLEQAAKGLDASAVAGTVDFPAVRANLSPTLTSELQGAIDAERIKPHSLIDRIGMAIAPLFHSKPAETLVTPEGVTVMLKTAAPPRYASPFHTGRDSDRAHPGEPYTVSQGYIDNDLDQFQAAIGNRLKSSAEVRIKLLRRGFLTWKITALDLDHDAPPTPGATGASTTTVTTKTTSN